MIRTLIIDDEPMLRQDMAAVLRHQPDVLVLGQCGSIRESLILIESTQPDLIFLDVQLSDGNSFSLLDQLPHLSFDVVFVTAFNEYAIRAIRLGAIDYILKPIDDDEVAAALNRIRQKPASGSPNALSQQLSTARASLQGITDRLTLRTLDCIYFIEIANIVYLQSEGNYTTFYLSTQRPIVVSRPLKEYEQILPPTLFIRTHQSYLVNRHWVERLRRDEGMLVLRSGAEIPVSSRRREEVITGLTHG